MVVLSIILLVGAIICALYFAKEEYLKYKLESLKTNLVTLQVKVKVLAEEVNIQKEGVSYIGKKLSENLEAEDIKALIDKNVISQEDENYEEYYILETEDLEEINFINASINKVIVNYKTYEIIYVDGFKIKDDVYYKLSDFSHLNKEENNQENEELPEENEGVEKENISDEES